MSFGTTPATAFGFAVHGGAYWRSFSLSGGIRAEFSLSDGMDTVRASASRLLGEAVPCLRWSLRSSTLFGCGVVQGGVLIARGQTSDYVGKRNAPTVSLGGRLSVQLPHPPIFPLGVDPFVSVDAIGVVRNASIIVRDRHACVL